MRVSIVCNYNNNRVHRLYIYYQSSIIIKASAYSNIMKLELTNSHLFLRILRIMLRFTYRKDYRPRRFKLTTKAKQGRHKFFEIIHQPSYMYNSTDRIIR